MARIAGLLVLLAAVPAILQAGRMRTPNAFCWITLALYLWFCCTCFWTVDSAVTLEKLRAYFQEMMIVWLVWEFADTPADLRDLLRATVAGSCVLAVLTLLAFRSPEALATGQIRFAAYGQDPNEVARFLDLGFPLAALLVNCERSVAAASHGHRISAARHRGRFAHGFAQRIPCRSRRLSPAPCLFLPLGTPAASRP